MDSQLNCVRDTVQSDLTLEERNMLDGCSLTCEDRIQLEDMDLEATNGVRKRKGESRSDDSQEEGWTAVSRARKIGRRQEISDENSIQICVTCKKDLPKQFALARLFKEHNVDKILRVKYVSSSKILITFSDESSADLFIAKKVFDELGWKCLKTSEVGISFGVIRNIEIDLTEEILLKHLSCSCQVVAARRLNKRNTEESGNAWIASESIRLSFKASTVPSHVYIHDMRIKVEPYIFPVTQCGKCWRYGHPSKFCPTKKNICPKCSGQHENCETVSFRCVNCYGSHMAMHKICPVFKKEKRIREMMSESNITYRKALSMYVPPIPVSDRLERHEYNLQENSNLDGLTISANSMITANTRASYVDVVKNSYKRKDITRVEQQTKEIQEKSQESTQSELYRSGKEGRSYISKSGKEKWKQKKRNTAECQSATLTWDNENSDSAEEEVLHTQDRPTSKSNKPKKSSTCFQLLDEFKEIIFSSESLDKKIEHIIKIIMDWVISKVVSTVMDRSFSNSSSNYG